ncbi:MAG: hypothetical protein ACK5BV_03135 [Bacteroidota bacterium]|jgi:hypothetical protein
MPFFIILFLFVFPFCSQAQVGLATSNAKFEVGLNIGPMNFLGDLGGNRGRGTIGLKDNNIPMTNFIGGLSAAYYPREWWGVRLALNVGEMEGDDRIIRDMGDAEVARKYRNITFRSPLYEGYLGVELFPTVYFSLRSGNGVPRFRPYILGGVGLFAFKPQGLYVKDGVEKWVDLKPLRLEGQGMSETGVPEYDLWSYNIPLGIGVKYDLTERLTFGIEIVHRMTGTDYIDDVSRKFIDPSLFDKYLSPEDAEIAKYMANPSSYFPGAPGYTPYRPGKKRGNPELNDAYFSSTFRLTWKIGDIYADWFKNKRSLRCPDYF